nr:Pr6Pr family membrane protein [Octadecabacter dasysiphoniae]
MQENNASVLGALWIDFRFFTIWTNALVGVVGAAIALGRGLPQWLTAGPALAIALVAGVYHALLAAGRNLMGLEYAVDMMMHTIIPAAFIAFWLFVLPKGRLAWRDLIIWSAYPTLYSIYAIARGTLDGVYPYFFLDVSNIGAAGVGLWVAGLALVFVLAGAIIVGTAHRTARHA